MQIIECVPNYSEGRDPMVIQQIAEAIRSVNGVHLLNIDPGEAANRTVMTFIGEAAAVVEAAFRGAAKAAELIDMQQQHGTHPRVGATDVLPLIPISGITLEECAQLARQLARRMADELGIPCYCYEAAAFKPERQNLAFCRRGEYEALHDKLTTKERQPDFMPADLSRAAKTGCSVVGARDFLIAVNFNLNTTSVPIAHAIACDVRQKGRKIDGVWHPGTLRGVKAIGWYIEEYGIAQVSMNITNFHVTPLHRAYEEVCRCARLHGVEVTGTEIIGMVPPQVLTDAARYFLQQQGQPIPTNENDLITVAIKSMSLDDLGPFENKCLPLSSL